MSSETRMMAAGSGLLVISFIVFRLTDAHLLAWVLLVVAMPLIFEVAAWGQAEVIASLLYSEKLESFREAYRFRNAAPRITLLYVWLFSVLFARETIGLPEQGWIAIALLSPIAAWAALAARSHHRCIRDFMAAR